MAYSKYIGSLGSSVEKKNAEDPIPFQDFNSFLFKQDSAYTPSIKTSLQDLKKKMEMKAILEGPANLDLFEDIRLFSPKDDTISVQGQKVYKLNPIEDGTQGTYMVKSLNVTFPNKKMQNFTLTLPAPDDSIMPPRKGKSRAWELVSYTIQFQPSFTKAALGNWVLGISNKYIPLYDVRQQLDYAKDLASSNTFIQQPPVNITNCTNGKEQEIPFEISQGSGYFPHLATTNCSLAYSFKTQPTFNEGEIMNQLCILLQTNLHLCKPKIPSQDEGPFSWVIFATY